MEAKPAKGSYRGRPITLEATSEILAKKLAYRADSFKARDVFDLATALDMDRLSAMTALRATRHTRPALMARLRAMQATPAADRVAELAMTASGMRHADGMIAKVLQAEHRPQRQRRGDGQSRVAWLPASRGSRFSLPGCDRRVSEPDGQTAALAQGGIIGCRVRRPVPLLGDVVTTGSVGLKRRG